MFTLYNTDKELFSCDYKPIQGILQGLSCTDILSLLENLESAIDNASVNGSYILENALYDDIATVKKQYITTVVKSYSSGYIAPIIGSTKYRDIDNAVNKTLYHLYHAETEELYNLSTDPDNIHSLIVECYHRPDIYGL